jgi:biotin-dependent carboxylase-like uncharacterized protein
MSLHVLSPGQMSLIVDRGRPRSRSLGVPVGGAADYFSFALGNALVGNPPDAPALEVCLVGPTLEADCSLACVVYGAEFSLHCNDQALTAGHTFTIRAGEKLQIGTCARGLRAYLCVQGGIDSECILHSRSALAPIQQGQLLACSPGSIGGRFIEVTCDREPDPTGDGTRIIRVLPGAQASWFPADAMSSSSYRVSTATNRMGVRLERPPLPLPGREMASEPVCPGSVQVTNNGQCIILGVEGQTIGGYPKVAQVISADIDLLGQLRPGEPISFQVVSLEEAERIWSRKQEVLNHWIGRLWRQV